MREFSGWALSSFCLKHSAIQGSLRNSGGFADVRLVVFQKLRFGPCVRMGGEAGEADGVERTIIVSSMRVKSSSLREHHICLLLGGDFNVRGLQTERWSISTISNARRWFSSALELRV
jgi:hypothetical protein